MDRGVRSSGMVDVEFVNGYTRQYVLLALDATGAWAVGVTDSDRDRGDAVVRELVRQENVVRTSPDVVGSVDGVDHLWAAEGNRTFDDDTYSDAARELLDGFGE